MRKQLTPETVTIHDLACICVALGLRMPEIRLVPVERVGRPPRFTVRRLRVTKADRAAGWVGVQEVREAT